jgi:hypothetical protein
MIEATVDLLRTPLAVLGLSGLLIGLGLILSDRRRWLGGVSSSKHQPGPPQGTTDQDTQP